MLGCCPPPICGYTRQSLACNFVNILPSGPLWDKEKIEVSSKLDVDGNYITDDCTSIIAHAIYTGHKLYDLITGPLFTSLVESDPFTAYETIDSWLSRLGWEDCYNSSCNKFSKLTPLEKLGDCGRVFCGDASPDDLFTTTKHRIVVALSRLNVGGIKNLEFINWVIEPLNSILEADPDECGGKPDVNSCFTYLTLRQLSSQIENWPKYEGCVQLESQLIDAQYIHTECNNNIVAPLTMAAHCIILSFLHCKQNIKITLL